MREAHMSRTRSPLSAAGRLHAKQGRLANVCNSHRCMMCTPREHWSCPLLVQPHACAQHAQAHPLRQMLSELPSHREFFVVQPLYFAFPALQLAPLASLTHAAASLDGLRKHAPTSRHASCAHDMRACLPAPLPPHTHHSRSLAPPRLRGASALRVHSADAKPTSR